MTATLVPLLTLWGLPSDRALATAGAVLLSLIAVVLLVPGPSGRLRRLSRLTGTPGVGRTGEETGPGPVTRLAGQLRSLLRARPGAWPARTRAAASVVAGVGVTALLVLAGLRSDTARYLPGVVAAAVCFVVAGRLEPTTARQRRLRMISDLPHTLELLAAALHAGLPLRAAVADVGPLVGGPLGDDLARVLRQIDLGVPEADAWRTLRDHPILGHLALDLARSVDSGTTLASTLQHHARESRRNRRGALEARARSVGVHSVPPLMVCFLPAFLLIGVVPTGVSAFLHSLG